MRIISGKYRGKIIHLPRNIKVRPTTDLAKESLFNIIVNDYDIRSVSVLDLFSGTGSISYEFASRDCKLIHLVENNYKNYSFIVKTMEELAFHQIRATRANVRSYIETCQTKYDIVFADPPYNLSWLGDLPDLVLGHGLLNPQGMFILEHPRSVHFSDHSCLMEKRQYGSVNFSFFKS
ncbi:MAG: 16S rRNA (guanine(966)-N(2))-methyltransferase RsmD [Bacteroidales bacterium]|nr:MAG: 16S rRNA (guanine(966)-N(2))-methyltransferase RsmD [Bacteroidales bacterium]